MPYATVSCDAQFFLALHDLSCEPLVRFTATAFEIEDQHFAR